jgi:peptidyl-prolyl cis-trans isomerase A (cyclophilin A)
MRLLLYLLLLFCFACRQKFPLLRMETTLGEIQIQLFEDTPLHSKNFLKYSKSGFYDGLTWQRISQDFAIESGMDSLYQGAEGITPEIKHWPVSGALVAATLRANGHSHPTHFLLVQGQKWTEKSLSDVENTLHLHLTAQERAAYLQQGGAPQLHGKCTVFGQIVAGQAVLDGLASVPRDAAGKPLSPLKILRIGF